MTVDPYKTPKPLMEACWVKTGNQTPSWGEQIQQILPTPIHLIWEKQKKMLGSTVVHSKINH